jgi:hypothetical protein
LIVFDGVVAETERLLRSKSKVGFVSKVPLEIFGSRPSNRQYRQPFHKIATVRLGRENDGQVLNLSGLLHGTFHQHLDDRFEVPWLGGHFVPEADSHYRSVNGRVRQVSG